MTSAKAGLFLPVFIILLAYLYSRRTDNVLRERLDQVLDGLLRAEKKVSVAPKTKVAVGFGGCMDVFVNATQFLQRFGAVPPESPAHHDVVRDQEGLEEVFAYFFRSGAAAERFVSDENLFKKVVEFTKSMPHARWTMGGNAPVMANRFASEGFEVFLGAKSTKNTKKYVHAGVTAVGGDQEHDDVHFVMEYDVGDIWGKYTATRANRFIIHSDDSNPTISALENFADALKGQSIDLLVVGGLQMLDNFPFRTGERQTRLKKLDDFLAAVPKKTMIHFEMASFTEEALLQDLGKHVLPYSDSLGANEQELPNLYSVLTGGKIVLLSDSNPRLAVVLDQMRAVFRALRERKPGKNQRRVTRLHIHTLAYQVILTVKGSSWKNTMSAAAKAALTAHRHTCGKLDIDTNDARMIMDDSFATSKNQGSRRISLDNNRPVSCWDEENYEICVAPVLVCTKILQTAGGGDNISSAGLVLQI
ncbi:ADP-dependent glucokinase-like [Lineus longissimus]|uniref:ADP-dependent glucokinase-like n=1 Tax=Lineus longissimus TaxID=88925 RepID=UPI002B4CC094